MALLTTAKRKEYFEKLGLGEYTEANIKKLQKKYLRKKDVDGIYGTDTDRLLRHVYNCSLVKDFEPTEFKCECGGRYCTGYPTYMKQVELKSLQKIRTHFGKPMKITSGMRCKAYNNSLRGSIPNSKHTTGYAADYYIAGLTDSLDGRKKVIKYAKSLSNHGYSYCNGYNSNGVGLSAPYMGSCIHTDSNKPVKPAKKTATDPLQKWYDAMKTQFNWSKNQVYAWVENPTVANSKARGTCITFPAVSLQRIGLLPKGGYFYFHPTKKKISGKSASYVKNHTDIFKLSYPNKTCKQLWDAGKIKKGDIVGFGNPAYHTMVFMGMNSKGKPLFNTMGHKRALNTTYPAYASRKVNMLVHIKKVR